MAGYKTRQIMQEWYGRGYIPHRDKIGLKQHVTFHLADSLPKKVIDRYKNEIKFIASGLRNNSTEDFEKKLVEQKIEKMQEYLDAGFGNCILRNPILASIVVDSILEYAAGRYEIHAWCVMPNHVHALIKTTEFSLSSIIRSWKSYTANKINKTIGKQQNIWQREYFDRYIRDDKHFIDTINYIEDNPVKAGLVKQKDEWEWSSAHS